MSSADKRLNSKGEVDEGPIPFFGNSGGDTDLFGSLVNSQPSQPTQSHDWQNTSYNDRPSVPPRSNSTAPATQSSGIQPFSPQYPTPQRPKTTDPSVHQGSENAGTFFDNYSTAQNVSTQPLEQIQGLSSAKNPQEASFFDTFNNGQQVYDHQGQAQTPSSYNTYQPQSYVDPNSQQYEPPSKETDWYSQAAYQQQYTGYEGVQGTYNQQPDLQSQYQGNYNEYQQTTGSDYGAYNNYYEGYNQQLTNQQDPSMAGYYNHAQESTDPNYTNPNIAYQNSGYSEGYGYDYTQEYDYSSATHDPAYADYYQQYGYNSQYTEGGEGYTQPVEQEAINEATTFTTHYPQQSSHAQYAPPNQNPSVHQGTATTEADNSDPSAFFESLPVEEKEQTYTEYETYGSLSIQDQTVPDSPAVALVNSSEEPEVNDQQGMDTQVKPTHQQYASDFRGESTSNALDTQEHSVPDEEVSITKESSDILETAEDHAARPTVHVETRKEPFFKKPLEQMENNDPLGQTEDIDINDPSLFDTAADMLSSFVGGVSYANDKQKSSTLQDDQMKSFEQSNSQPDNLDDLDDLVLGSTPSPQDSNSFEKNKESEKDLSSDHDNLIGEETSPNITSLSTVAITADALIEEDILPEVKTQTDDVKSEITSDSKSNIHLSEPSPESLTLSPTPSIPVHNDETITTEVPVKEEEISVTNGQNSEKDESPLDVGDVDIKDESNSSSEDKKSSEEVIFVSDQQNHGNRDLGEVTNYHTESLDEEKKTLPETTQEFSELSEQHLAKDSAQQSEVEPRSDGSQSLTENQNLEIINQKNSDYTNIGDETPIELDLQGPSESEHYSQGELVVTESCVVREPSEHQRISEVSVNKSLTESTQESPQNAEKLPYSDDAGQFHVDANGGHEKEATDISPEHVPVTQIQPQQDSNKSFTDVYPNEQSYYPSSEREQYGEIPISETNFEGTAESTTIGSEEDLKIKPDTATNQDSWEEVPGYHEDYNGAENSYAQDYNPNDVPIGNKSQTISSSKEELLTSDTSNPQHVWKNTHDYNNGEQQNYSQEYYNPHDYQHPSFGDTPDGHIDNSEQPAYVQDSTNELPNEGVVPNDNNNWQTEGAVYGSEYENYGYYHGQQYGSDYYTQGQGEAVENQATTNQDPLEQYSSENQGAVVPGQESYYNEQGYFQDQQVYDPNQGYYSQEYSQYDTNSVQPGSDIQYATDQYSAQDTYGGASENYQSAQEQEPNRMYYDQQAYQQYSLNQDTSNRGVDDIQTISNYTSDQDFTGHYDPNIGQGDSYYGNEGVGATGINDPLGRTKGSPIVTFGFGGKVVFMFPQVVTRFSTSSSTPVTKVYPGELKFHSLGNIIGKNNVTAFPGPLLFDSEKSSAKARKKAVAGFLDAKIKELSETISTQTEDDAQNEIILWKLLQVMCDRDGILLGSTEIEQETLEVVFPKAMHKRDTNVSSNPPQHKQASPGALDSLQELLLKGDRTVATKFAMDNRLWAHALIIGSCVGKETWQQVVQKFTQEELASDNSSNRESMTVMYNLFAGLGKDAIKDFVPESTTNNQSNMFTPAVLPELLASPIANQPLQNSVSTDKLSRWRETLAMILANRTPGDTLALTSFGDLLRNQGWIYAAHICYLLSPQSSIHSGLDTPSVKTVLLGVDHVKYLTCFARNLSALDRTEIYEHAISLRSTNPIHGLPFLQPYKLHRAWYLADCGYTAEALRYCESIANIVKIHPKGSPYFHELFLEKLKELHERLTKSLGDKATSSNVSTLSWLTTMKKPTLGSLMDAVDRGLNRFIVGESENPKPKTEVTHEITADPFTTYNPRVSILQTPNMEVPVRSASVNDITSRYEHLRKLSAFNHNSDIAHSHGRRSASPSGPSSGINQYEGAPMAVSRSYTASFTPTNVRGEVESKITEDHESPYELPESNNVYSTQSQALGQHTEQPQPQPSSGSSWENTSYGYGYGYEQNSEYNTQNQQKETPYAEESNTNANANQYGWPQNSTSEYNPYGYQAPPATDVNDYSSAYNNNSNQEGQFVSLMSNSASLVPTFGSTGNQPSVAQQAPTTQSYNDDDDFDDLGFGNKSLSRKKQSEAPKTDENSQNHENESQVTQTEASEEKSEEKEQPDNKGGWSLFSFLGRKRESKPAPVKAHLPSGNNFYFDEAQNRWVNKAATAEESKPAALPPPPSGPTRAQSASPTVGTLAGGPPSLRSSPGPSMLGPPVAAMGMTRSHSSTSGTSRRGVRNRYVDVMNPN